MKKVYITAVFIAIIAGIATYMFASELQKNTKIKDAPMSEVVVAIQDIRENTVITAEMVEVRLYTTASVTPGTVSKLEDLVGKLARYPIFVGEQILASKLIGIGEKDERAALSYQLLPGEYAYSITIGSEQGVSGFITRGDYVDILFTELKGDGTYKTDFVMRNVYVLRVSNHAANLAADAQGGAPITSYMELTFKLNESQCIQLSDIRAKGDVRLVLKSITTGETLQGTVEQTEKAEEKTGESNSTKVETTEFAS
jgi:pilus assembly protein CpaB